MPWIEIPFEEYRDLYTKEQNNLHVYSSGTCMAGGYIGKKYFLEDYFATTWGFKTGEPLNYIRSLKEYGEWRYWKWEGPMPQEDD